VSVTKGESHNLVQNHTETNIGALKRGRTQFEKTVPGFGVRAYRSGAKAFVVATTFEGENGRRKNKWVTLGPATGPEAIPLSATRDRARAELAQLKVNGGATRALTLRKAIDIYADEPRLARKTVVNTKAMLGKHCKDWLDRRLLEIKGNEVVDLYNSLLPTQVEIARAERLGLPTPSAAKANSVADCFRSVWTNAVDRLEFPGGVPPQCPTRALKRHRQKNRARTSLVTDVHLSAIGDAMRAYVGPGKNPAYMPYMLMVILNGMRAAEPSKLRWVFVGTDAFRLPEHRTKQRRELEVPMTAANKAIVDRMRALEKHLREALARRFAAGVWTQGPHSMRRDPATRARTCSAAPESGSAVRPSACSFGSVAGMRRLASPGAATTRANFQTTTRSAAARRACGRRHSPSSKRCVRCAASSTAHTRRSPLSA
jgi:integrase